MGLLEAFGNRSFGIAFFTRGRGRGHAVPDMAIAEEMKLLIPDLDIRFISYSTGAATFRSRGYDVIDMGMAADPHLFDAIVHEARIIGSLQPQLVIAHEEFTALPTAEIFQIPCVFITDFFLDPTSLPINAMRYATEIIFTGERGIFTEPPYLRTKVRYVGPAVRRFEYRRADRSRARDELGLPADATVLLCLPGSWPESQVPVVGLLAAAWAKLPYPSKCLIWLAGDDYDLLSARFAEDRHVLLLKEERHIDRLIAASDLVVTKANRLTVYEAASLGAPSLSLSTGANWPDDAAVAQVSSNTLLDPSSLTPDELASIIAERVSCGWVPEGALPRWGGVVGAARSLAAHVHRIRLRDST